MLGLAGAQQSHAGMSLLEGTLSTGVGGGDSVFHLYMRLFHLFSKSIQNILMKSLVVIYFREQNWACVVRVRARPVASVMLGSLQHHGL